MNLLLTILVTLSVPIRAPVRHSGLGSSMVAVFSPGNVRPHTFWKNSCTMPYFWVLDSPRLMPTLGQEGLPAACLPGHVSPLQSDSMLEVCSTTLKRLDRPSLRPLSTGLSRVVVDRAHADPLWAMLRFGRFHMLRSLEEVEDVSSLEDEDEAETLLVSLGEPYFGEQQGRSMRPCTFSSDEEIWRDRAEVSEVDGRGDHTLPWNPAPLEAEEAGLSVCKPTLTNLAVCVPVLVKPTVWLPVSLLHFLSRELERIACRTQLVISFMSSLRFAEISSVWRAPELPVLPSSRSLCCWDNELSHCSYEDDNCDDEVCVGWGGTAWSELVALKNLSPSWVSFKLRSLTFLSILLTAGGL